MFVLGSARLDTENHLLTVGSRTVALQRKPCCVLQHLIENRHRMILRKELLDQFWDGKDVYDQSLSKAVGNIRRAFGESRDSSTYIETRWGLGYRYVGPFGESPEAPLPPDEAVPEISPPISGPELLSTKHSSHRWLNRLLFVSLIFVVGIVSVRTRLHRAMPANAVRASTLLPIRSIAVLSFTAHTDQQQDQYLGVGLADAVADKLSTADQLSVRSSSTVRSVLGPHPDIATAGKRLKVQALVVGDLHRIADKDVITVRLVDSSSGADLWSGTYHADDTNVFATEASIAQQVSSALLPELGMNALKPSSGPDTLHPQAYSNYMKAEFFASTRTQNSLSKAIDLLHQAILIDPNYARAYAALASCYQLQGFYHFAPPEEAYPRAKAAAFKALSLDRSLAEAHAALLSILTDYDWDWEGATREFRATIAIDPNYAVAYQFYGYALLGMGRGEEGLATMKHAAELDPVSPSIQTSLAWAYYLLRQNDQAVDQCHRVLELYPDFVPAHQLLGIVFGQINAEQKSMAQLTLAEKLESDSTITPILIDYQLAKNGNRSEASRNLTDIFQQSHGASLPDYYFAAAWAAIGDKQQAGKFLDRAYHARSNWVIYLQYDPRFDGLRPDPQFQALVHHVAFSQSNSVAMLK
jgi:TolB-like protein/DNA-binding winged helix-turn-helix (wHTH) protein/tetratricopeptide (TPR) repeat protein